MYVCMQDNRSISVWQYPSFIHNPCAHLHGAFLGQGNQLNRKCSQSCLLSYRKAFDLIDHHILAERVSLLSMPLFVKRWVINFLINRQKVKLADILSGVPQGTKLGPWLFLLMIKNLWSPKVQTWKYIDDTTISEVMHKGSTTNIHHAVDNVQTWSTTDRLPLNVAKYTELVISFSKTANNFPSLNIDSGQLEVVMNA